MILYISRGTKDNIIPGYYAITSYRPIGADSSHTSCDNNDCKMSVIDLLTQLGTLATQILLYFQFYVSIIATNRLRNIYYEILFRYALLV